MHDPAPLAVVSFSSRDVRFFRCVSLGPSAGDAIYQNTEKNGAAPRMSDERNGCWLPAHRMPLKKALGTTSVVRVFGCFWKLLVFTEDDQCRPLFVTGEFFNLEAHKTIHSHPIDFLSYRGVTIKGTACELNMNGNDVGLIVYSARKAGEACSCEHFLALTAGHFLNYHAISHAFGNLAAA